MSVFNFNKKSDNKSVRSNAQPPVINRANSHKKKNTYIVCVKNLMADLSMHASCSTTPIAVITLNGKQVQNTGDWMNGTMFPNPMAANMQKVFKKLSPVMGETMASTIVEYLDKYNGKPVLTLFPQNAVYFHEYQKTVQLSVEQEDDKLVMYLPNTLAQEQVMRLNHATRTDLIKQVLKRQKLISDYQQNNQR